MHFETLVIRILLTVTGAQAMYRRGKVALPVVEEIVQENEGAMLEQVAEFAHLNQESVLQIRRR